MRRTVLAVLAVAASGCGAKSELDKAAQVSVHGRALRADAAPLSSTRALLVKEPDLGEVVAGFTAMVGSLGLACLAEEPPALCSSAHRTVTDADGAFRFSLMGRDTQGSMGQASTFNLAVRGAARSGSLSGPARTERFTIQRTNIEVPTMKLWDPELGVQVEAARASVTFGALPAGADEARVRFVHDGTEVLSSAVTSGQALDGRLLEDVGGSVSVSTGARDNLGGTAFEHVFETESRAFQGLAGAPPSRGKSCAAVGPSGVAVPIAPCSLTDGNFKIAFTPPADSGCQPDAEG